MSEQLTQAQESLFWYWIAERHAIYLRRLVGRPKPWTTDPIFQQYKFTNPFRENDRGTVWLRENFLIPHRDDAAWLLAFNICWYRMFNWWGTGKLLGWRTEWNEESVIERLNVELRNGRQVFTGAHIIYSPPGKPKIDAIVEVCGDLYLSCQTHLFEGQTLEWVFGVLNEVHCVGGFMAYEMVTDMRHTKILENATDIYTWANPGPGAIRGLQRLGLPSKPKNKAIESMRHLLSHAPMPEGLESSIMKDGLEIEWPQFEMRDIEHSLCEFDKYCRVKFGEGEPRAKFAGV
jgi:5-hmdU DNA kinase, helical domain